MEPRLAICAIDELLVGIMEAIAVAVFSQVLERLLAKGKLQARIALTESLFVRKSNLWRQNRPSAGCSVYLSLTCVTSALSVTVMASMTSIKFDATSSEPA